MQRLYEIQTPTTEHLFASFFSCKYIFYFTRNTHLTWGRWIGENIDLPFCNTGGGCGSFFGS